ncbi:MAG TPA: replication-relaxation family protein [Candidatus Saccharimonadia bacterium]
MAPLPRITPKQHEIIQLLYRYRFLNRTQIQQFLGHTDKRRIISWLKDLRDKQYLDWRYDPTNFIAKSQPAVYHLALNGVRLLRETGEYSADELHKRYKEAGRTIAFADHCVLIGNCCLALHAKSAGDLKYEWALPADYAEPGSKFCFIAELKPHLYFTKEQGYARTSYALELIEPTLPRYQLRKRLQGYVNYLRYEWDEANGPAPITLFVCSTTADLIYAKHQLRQILNDDDSGTIIRLTTRDKLIEQGLTAMIWEEV